MLLTPEHDGQCFAGVVLGHIHVEVQAVLRAQNVDVEQLDLWADCGQRGHVTHATPLLRRLRRLQ